MLCATAAVVYEKKVSINSTSEEVRSFTRPHPVPPAWDFRFPLIQLPRKSEALLTELVVKLDSFH